MNTFYTRLRSNNACNVGKNAELVRVGFILKMLLENRNDNFSCGQFFL